MITIRISLAVVVMAALASPGFALPNTGAFARSSEGFKTTFQDLCQHIQGEIDGIEDKDSPIAPTKTGTEQKKRAADELRNKARENGCKI